MTDGMVGLVVGLAVLGVVVLVLLVAAQHRAKAERSEALHLLARSREWRFRPKDDQHGRRWDGKPFTRGGTTRNVLTGFHRGRPCSAFEYQYTTMVSTGTTTTAQTHVFSVWTVQVPARVPALTVDQEGAFGGRVAEAFGFTRVDTGDAEFDQTFKVKSDDDAFARAVLTPDVIAALKRTGPWSWRLTGDTMLSYDTGALDPDAVVPRLDRMAELLELVPAQVWGGPPAGQVER